MKRLMKRKDHDSITLSPHNMRSSTYVSQLKQSLLHFICSENTDLKKLKSIFPNKLPIESLIYMLEMDSLIKLINGVYTPTKKGLTISEENEVSGKSKRNHHHGN
jgi:hypothetical protein